jgi:carboxymethylenebutenolidase
MDKVTDGGWDYEVFKGDSNVGVVLVHEVFGLDDYIRDAAKALANLEFSVAAVDLYHGKYGRNLEESFALRSAVTRPILLDCMSRGMNVLQKVIKSANSVVGAMGFCMGGGFSLYAACHLDFGFTVVYYGSIDEIDDVKNLKGPVMLVEGLESERDMAWVKDKFVPSVAKYQTRTDMHFYPKAGHAFHRAGTSRHNAQAAKDAWNKTIAFISQFKS